MPNSIGPTGLTTATQAELLANFTTDYQVIYGNDINLDQDTPDGQMMMIFIQAVLDVEDLLTQIYNMFDPDNAVGNVLDQRVAINGIQRQAGTHTMTNVTVVTSQSITLYGADQSVNAPYLIADNEGNQWELLTTISLPSDGTYVLAFEAAVPGAILSVPNTITVPVSVVLGVVSVNNPTTYTTLGLNEETDAELKVRRQKSVSLSSQGYLQGLLAALDNISGVVSAFVYENVTGTTDGDGIPGHSIWVIVSGAASPVSIANAIYTKRNAGCGMKGTQTYNILQADGSNFTIRWDFVTPENLFIKFTATSLDGVNPPNISAIKAQLVTLFVPGVNQQVNINELSTLVQDIDPNTLVTSAGFSTSSGGTYTNTLLPASKDKQFAVSSPDIIILPMILNPTASTVLHGGTVQFSTLGGFGTLTYAIHTNNSGGTINSSSGLYTSGSTPSTDTVRVTDSLGNFTDVPVVVT